ncbi:hypothetical protein HMPREF0758_3047 [Serratia odorifera DSM 4582]|uniref:Uncharacterized protein n=1 Tax=Serratia odorifera DSM 4582 TaxID=667129 RepID=D4E4E7_SEROD|nr:hypothetical protein HMPREF0758_3047 [Serratia odorifera DSM 4582]
MPSCYLIIFTTFYNLNRSQPAIYSGGEARLITSTFIIAAMVIKGYP